MYSMLRLITRKHNHFMGNLQLYLNRGFKHTISVIYSLILLYLLFFPPHFRFQQRFLFGIHRGLVLYAFLSLARMLGQERYQYYSQSVYKCQCYMYVVVDCVRKLNFLMMLSLVPLCIRTYLLILACNSMVFSSASFSQPLARYRTINLKVIVFLICSFFNFIPILVHEFRLEIANNDMVAYR